MKRCERQLVQNRKSRVVMNEKKLVIRLRIGKN